MFVDVFSAPLFPRTILFKGILLLFNLIGVLDCTRTHSVCPVLGKIGQPSVTNQNFVLPQGQMFSENHNRVLAGFSENFELRYANVKLLNTITLFVKFVKMAEDLRSVHA